MRFFSKGTQTSDTSSRSHREAGGFGERVDTFFRQGCGRPTTYSEANLLGMIIIQLKYIPDDVFS